MRAVGIDQKANNIRKVHKIFVASNTFFVVVDTFLEDGQLFFVRHPCLRDATIVQGG